VDPAARLGRLLGEEDRAESEQAARRILLEEPVLNEVLLLGALLSFAGAALALWLVREREIEREPAELARDPDAEAVADAAAA